MQKEHEKKSEEDQTGIVWFGRSEEAAEKLGAKARNLSKLQSKGFRVPNGFAVTKVANKERVLEALRGIKGEEVAVRSAAKEEDGKGKSYAGMYESFLNVKRRDEQEVWRRIEMCRESAKSGRVMNYKAYFKRIEGEGHEREEEEREVKETEMDVIVQEMVTVGIGGVAFTINPVSLCGDEIVVEIFP